MATVSRILAGKGARVHTIDVAASVLDAARRMNEQRIGGLVVTGPDGQVVGIVTERDVLRRLVAQRRDPGETPVGEIMTRDVICCQPQTPVDEARQLFMQKRIRHLPVLDEQGGLAGLISIGDINAHDLDGQQLEIRYLHEYIHGRV
ncbi:MAG: CBS domain-containing protein [Phycisphaeraceae bacterium]